MGSIFDVIIKFDVFSFFFIVFIGSITDLNSVISFIFFSTFIITFSSKLYNFGLIYGNGYPTSLGLLINKIRNLSIENAIMVLSGYNYGCNILDLITIASYNMVGKSKLILKGFKSFNVQFDNSILDFDKVEYNN